MSGAIVKVVRSAVQGPDAYDRHAAVVSIDGVHVADLELDNSVEVPVTAEAHEIGIRLQASFGTATAAVCPAEGGTTTVVCEKAYAARNQVLHPSHYWRLTVD